jgi:hypothetical protein
MRRSRAFALRLIVLPALLAPLSGSHLPLIQSTPKPKEVIKGIVHYERRGLSAAPPVGFVTGVMVGGAAAVASQRAMKGFFKILAGASALTGRSSMREMNDFLRSTDQIDMSGWPVKAEYGADAFFTLEEGKDGVFQLKDGSVDWSARNNTRIELAGEGGNVHIFHDKANGQGSSPLTPERSSITLRTEGKGKDLTFTLDMDISHVMPYDGSGLWSAMGGLSVMRVEERAGTQQWHMSFLGQEHTDPPIPGEPGQGGFGYTRTGPLNSVSRGREVWLNLFDSPERIEYELFLNCDASIKEPAADAPLIFDDKSPARLENKARAEARPAPWARDLKWKLPAVEGSETEPAEDERTGAEFPFGYKGMPERNKDFGKRNIEASFASARNRSASCRNPEPQPVRFFFPRDAENNPGSPNAPNWFHYWKQTPAALGHETAIHYQPDVSKCTSEQTDRGGKTVQTRDFGYYPFNSFAEYIYVCDLRPSGFKTALLFGGAKVDGIDVFGVTVIHEWKHKTNFETWWKRGYSTREDGDEDRIPDDKEESVTPPAFLTSIPGAPAKFDPIKYDTFGHGWGDEHYLAYAEELNWKVGSADSEDWSCPGHQAGKTCP